MNSVKKNIVYCFLFSSISLVLSPEFKVLDAFLFQSKKRKQNSWQKITPPSNRFLPGLRALGRTADSLLSCRMIGFSSAR